MEKSLNEHFAFYLINGGKENVKISSLERVVWAVGRPVSPLQFEAFSRVRVESRAASSRPKIFSLDCTVK